jgi:hypothetical protein
MPRRPVSRNSGTNKTLPRSLRDAPEQFQEGTTEPTGAGTPNSAPVPLTTTPHFDNPLNPRGISSNLCNGVPDNQATDSQKVQNPTPARAPQAATTYPMTVGERVSAGQNRKPPQEVIP